MELYILGAFDTPIRVPDRNKWEQWFLDHEDKKNLAKDQVFDSRVSTIFAGQPFGYEGDAPLLYETRIFGGKFDGWTEWSPTNELALENHQRAFFMLLEDVGLDRDILKKITVQKIIDYLVNNDWEFVQKEELKKRNDVFGCFYTYKNKYEESKIKVFEPFHFYSKEFPYEKAKNLIELSSVKKISLAEMAFQILKNERTAELLFYERILKKEDTKLYCELHILEPDCRTPRAHVLMSFLDACKIVPPNVMNEHLASLLTQASKATHGENCFTVDHCISMRVLIKITYSTKKK